MRRPTGRARVALLLCAAALARGGAASSAAATCASCKSLLGALQRRALDGGARALLRGACAARPEAQVRRGAPSPQLRLLLLSCGAF
jgi:hypothetical protein